MTSFTLFTVTSNQFLTYRITSDMEKELDVIGKNLKDNESPYWPIGELIRNNLMRLVQSNIIIIQNDSLIYWDNDEVIEDLSAHNGDYTYLARNYIIAYDELSVGPYNYEIILLSEKSMITALNQINLSILFITSLISMLIASFFGIYVQNNISRPIHLLRNKVRDFQESLDAPKATIFTGDEIQELDEDLVKMAESIVQNDRKRKAFFENTSHELKTPLMNIKGYAEGLKDGIFSIDEAADVIQNESDALRTLVEAILYLSKLEDATHDRYQFQLVDVNDFLDGFYHKMYSLVSDKELEFILNLDKAVQVKIDDDKMIRALSNIITNAVRYAKTKIVIQTLVEDSTIEIRLFNDGPQILDKDLPHLFDRFYKGDKGQSGLGLAIVKTIISVHHGTVEAFNVENGVCMSIKLPCVVATQKKKKLEHKKG